MSSLSWEVIKEFYLKEFGIDEWLVEMYANLDILCLCASGVSFRDISVFLEVPISEVKTVANSVFEFDGWEEEIPVNPLYVFKSYKGVQSSVEHFMEFDKEIKFHLSKWNGKFADVKTEKLFYICETYLDIEERIRNEWI